MQFQAIFAEAIQQDDPGQALRTALVKLRATGCDRETLLDELQQYRIQTRSEMEEDVVLDVMDFLVGYCSPHMRID